MSHLSCNRSENETDAIARPAGRWHPNAFMRFTLILHAAAAGMIVVIPGFWQWPVLVVGLNQLILILAGLWPKSDLLGSNLTRLPATAIARGEVSITIDDGPNPEITPRVLDLLDRYDAKASFFCIADMAYQYPELCREIVSRGHSIENHSLRHRLDFAFSGYRGFLREISEAQEILARVSGSRPLFFRAPFGIRNPILEPVLSRLGLQLASWTRRGFDTQEQDFDKVRQRLLKDLAAGDILLLHDANSARTSNGEVMILRVLPALLEAIREARLHSVSLRNALG